ncbi:MAG: hypothetical protein JO345_34310 [Streptosporangiaceae bacterium]|nr:hypothetical protein [Streptosporangiaceae bacterium]
MLSTNRLTDRRSGRYTGGNSEAGDPWERLSDSLREYPTAPLPPRRREENAEQVRPSRPIRATRLRRIPLWVKWTAVIALAGLIFRKVIAFGVVTALSVVLHVVGINAHLPHIKLAWPWQSVTAGTTTNVDLGPWVLQKIEGISKPALGTENFNFVFTHKVSKNIGFWPCWYASTFYAVGRASATVDLNPGPSWWTKASDHYRLQTLSRPVQGKPGRVSIVVVLPQPQLPQSSHDVSIDNSLSQPLNVQHSWTYPGFGCGVVVRPQFSQSVLYSLAQSIAFDRVRHVPQVYRPLITTAENEATQMIRDNFIQPTVNAFGYTLASFSIHWTAAAP